MGCIAYWIKETLGVGNSIERKDGEVIVRHHSERTTETITPSQFIPAYRKTGSSGISR
jgi:hypothetical protein